MGLPSSVLSPEVSPRGRPLSRGHILKSLALKPQVLENCPVLDSRTALVFEQLKFCWKTPETMRKICKDLFLLSSSRDRLKKNFENLFRLKNIFEDLFFGEHLRLCPCSLASRGSVLGLGIFLRPWPRALCP